MNEGTMTEKSWQNIGELVMPMTNLTRVIRCVNSVMNDSLTMTSWFDI